MNIAIIIPALSGGGAERVAQKLGDHYVETGDKVYYFLLDDHGRQAYEVKGEIVKTGIIPPSSSNEGGMKGFLYRLFLASLEIRRLKRKYHIDAAISFMEECNYLNILSQRGERVITRICTILSLRDDMNRFLYDPRVIRFFYSLPCRIVVMSRYAKKDMEDVYSVDSKKIHIIPNPVECRARKNTGSDKYKKSCVITVGRMDPVKQQDRIIRAFSVVVERVPEARLVFVGRGDNERYLKSVARRMGIEDHIEFAGFCRDVWGTYGSADCFVMSSKTEGFPNGMVEAMACGIPVVSTDSPGGVGDILGKEIEQKEYYKLCKYGLKTDEMPRGKADNGTDLTNEEKQLGIAMADIVVDQKLHEHYSKAARGRIRAYRSEKVFDCWDKLRGKVL